MFVIVYCFLHIFLHVIQSCAPAADPLLTEPLILTPLIKEGNIDEARLKSTVKPLIRGIFSNSGYLTVNDRKNSNLFFWFFQKTEADWKKAPILLWLQGGPGTSSLYGLFTENGPFKIVRKNKITRRQHSWTNEYNVLYIDNPIGTGYSFTTDYYVTTQIEIGSHLYEALTQFFRLFPELRKNDFFITGESYAGKYIPAVAYFIHKNSNLKLEHGINLKGLIIGNGFTDPESAWFASYLHRLGLVDFKTKVSLESIEKRVKVFIRSGLWKEAFLERAKILSSIRNATQFKSLYDYTQKKKTYNETAFVEFIQEDKIREAIHVGKTDYNVSSRAVLENLKEEVCQSVRTWVEELIEHYPIMVYSGQLDIIVNHEGTSTFLEKLQWTGAAEYNRALRKKWYLEDKLVGYYKNAGNLKEALILSATHMVPAGKPKVMLELLRRFIKNDF